jgi:hypothetical protein
LLVLPGCSGHSDDANDNKDCDKDDIVCPHGWWFYGIAWELCKFEGYELWFAMAKVVSVRSELRTSI